MSDPLSGDAVHARLEALRGLVRPQRIETMEQPPRQTADMSPAAVHLRLEELRALLELTRWLQSTPPLE